MYQLSGTIRRILGRKVLELNGNAVLGFKQNFDLEEDEKSIVCRAIGTAVKLGRFGSTTPVMPLTPALMTKESSAFLSPTLQSTAERTTGNAEDPLLEEDELAELSQPAIPITLARAPDPVLLTLSKYPEHTIIGTGGFVCAASIKVLDNDSREVRESWWNEARDEVKSHARTLNCNYVVGYHEQASIYDEVVFLYCSGTAVNVDLNAIHVSQKDTVARASTNSLITSPKFGSNPNLVPEPTHQGSPAEESPTKQRKKKPSINPLLSLSFLPHYV
jgi:uncharacterized protein YbjQ (UPF0145 family)